MTTEQKLDQELDLIEDTLASIKKMLEWPVQNSSGDAHRVQSHQLDPVPGDQHGCHLLHAQHAPN